jgi:hypothetical protein
MADREDYYATLHVAPDATEEDIRLAFRRLARLYHPDVAGTGSLSEMQRLNVAYQTLSHPERRRQYDLSRGYVPAARAEAANHTATSRPPSPSAQTHAPTERRASVTRRPGPFRHVATLATPDVMPVTSVTFAEAVALAGAGLIDGRVLVFDLTGATLLRTLAFGPTALAGVLHEVRLSPSGTFAAAWGFQLGTRVWRVDVGKALWTLGASAPAGSMDLALTDDPQQVRLATPDAPLALADEDPFRWAHDGRHGTAIFTRPFGGPISARWTQPLHCMESGRLHGARGDDWFVHQRILARDGTRLLTLSSLRGDGDTRKGLLRLWDIEHRGIFGTTRPQQVARVACPAGGQWFPLTATPELGTVALGHLGRAMYVLALGTRAGSRIETGPIPSEARAALSPDGTRLALARGTALDVWDTQSGAPLAAWQFAAEITAVEFGRGLSSALLGIGLANGLIDMWG